MALNNVIKDGVWVTMLTPFDEDHQVDYPALEAMIEWYIQKGVAGLFAICQSSEMFFLSKQERAAVAKFVVEKAAGRVGVVASGHISDDIYDQIEELKDTAASGCDAVVLVSNRLAKQDESEDIWKANAIKIMEAIPDCTFGIYECPMPYRRLLSPELLKWCADTGRFAFLKDVSCDMELLSAKMDAIKGSSLKLFNANTATILDSLKVGVNGFCGVMANMHPELYVWLCEKWHTDEEKALMVQNFATVASLQELQSYPICAKYHMQLCGLPTKIYTRSKDDTQWNHLREIETLALYNQFLDFIKYCPLD